MNTKIENKSLYKRFCSTYIPLLHLQILDGLQLLQTGILDDIRSKSYLILLEKSLNLNKILEQTLLL